MNPTGYKKVPCIATDYCMGCGLCAKACDHECIEMVWDFATFMRIENCGSCGVCMDVCPHDVIHMDWVESTADRTEGEWRDAPPAPVGEPEPARHWLLGWLPKRTC